MLAFFAHGFPGCRGIVGIRPLPLPVEATGVRLGTMVPSYGWAGRIRHTGQMAAKSDP